MPRLIATTDDAPYGKTEAEIERALLARSHATWGGAGRPVQPPDPRGHKYVRLARALHCLWGSIVVLAVGWSMVGGKGTHVDIGVLRVDVGSWLPRDKLPAIAEPPFWVIFAAFLTAILIGFLASRLDLTGKRMLREAPQQLAGRAVSVRNASRRLWTWAGAIAAGLVGAALFSRPFFYLNQETDLRTYLVRDLPPALVGLLLIVAAFYIGERAWRLGQPSAAELQANDPRPPVLLLRSFHDENLRILRVTEDTDREGRRGTRYGLVRLEEAVADQFAPYGPLVAIGKPGEPLPTAGAARNYYSDAEWKDAVAKWMDEAQIILLVPGLTKGLGWELDAIERRGHIHKLLVLMPSAVGGWAQLIRSAPVIGWGIAGLARLGLVPDTAGKAQEVLQKRWDVIRKAVGDVASFAGLPEQVPEGAVVLHLGRDRAPTVIVGPYRADEEHYEQAIRLAVYGMLCDAG